MTPETAVKHQIRDYLRSFGWFVYHNMAGLGSYPGLSDMVAVKDGFVLFIEAKAGNGRQSDNQVRFQNLIESHGGNYVLAYGYEDVEKCIAKIKNEVPIIQEPLFQENKNDKVESD